MTTAEHIAASALACFHRHGFHASGVDLLAADAGVTKKTLYRHYPSKNALIDAALALHHRCFMARMRRFVETAAVAQRPLAYIDFIADWTTDADFHGCAFINATAEHSDPNAGPHQQAAAHKREIRSYLLALCKAAGVKCPGSVALAIHLIGEGFIVACQVQGREPALIDAARASARALCSDIANARAEPGKV